MQDDDPTVQLERLMSTGITAGMQGSTTKTPVPSTATPASQTSSPSVYANSDVNLDIDLVEGRNDWLNIQPIIRLGLNALAQKLERHLDVAAETERMVHTKAPIADLQMLASQFRALESHMDTQMDAKVDARNFERRAQETWLELEQRLEALSRDGQHALDSRVSPLENKLNTEAKLVEDMRISIVTMKTSIAEGVADASKRTAESDFQLKGEAEKLAAALRAERLPWQHRHCGQCFRAAVIYAFHGMVLLVDGQRCGLRLPLLCVTSLGLAAHLCGARAWCTRCGLPWGRRAMLHGPTWISFDHGIGLHPIAMISIAPSDLLVLSYRPVLYFRTFNNSIHRSISMPVAGMKRPWSRGPVKPGQAFLASCGS
ncbi:hypothetical protein CYMTET_31918 [Cymbomonas tetramitiformis]|uniref:Uncharacterized protein n=1 Tax=Cymbomonas tetramitiformis TaxID=36881 RepID=A0AAE0KSR3_9CHLO|nr:hypothetical protein CYMTET_31918 [Cymbomonas tetramitiformis]